MGGADGIDNFQAKQLANRTAYLKQQQEAHEAAIDPHPQYMTTDESVAAIAAAVAALVNSSPAALDTLSELATALGNDPNYAATITNALADKTPWTVVEQILTAGGIVIDHNVPSQLLTALRAAGVFTTPAQFDNTTKAATMAAINRALGSDSGFTALGAGTVLTAAHAGNLVQFNSGAAMSVDLPLASSVRPGTKIPFINVGVGVVTLNRQGAENIYDQKLTAFTALNFLQGDTLVLEATGSNWYAVSGSVTGITRKRLLGNLTLYVSTTGSDSNNGLTAGTAFATIQKALDVLQSSYDLNGYTVTVQLADGTYNVGGQALTARQKLVGQLGYQQLVFQGNSGTPANVVVSATSGNCFYAYSNAQFTIKDLKMQTTTAGSCIVASDPGVYIVANNVVFGTSAGSHTSATYGAQIWLNGGYSIVGSAAAGFHLYAANQGAVYVSGGTVTLTGTPAFSGFAYANMMGVVSSSATFSGSATGTRYTGGLNSVINSGGGGANYFPGNVAGGVTTGAQYN